MEADKVTEEPHTTMDAEEHLSSEDSSAEDSQERPIPEEPPISETPLEPFDSESHMAPSTSQVPLETHTSETPLEPSMSEIPLKTDNSETPLKPSIPETPLGHSTSEVSLETPNPEILLGTHTSDIEEKHLTFHTSLLSQVSASFSDDPKEEPFESSLDSIQTTDSESLQKHSLSGPPASLHLDTPAKEGEEEEEGEKGVDATDSTTHTAQPEQKPGYTVHPMIPAKQTNLVKVAKALHREKSGAQVDYLFQWEKDAALNAIQTGLYIGWRCPHYLWDCFQIGDESKCFCGHLLREHHIISDISVPCNVGQCRCLMFCFIPSRPEEVGEFWLKRRTTFDPRAWRAQCRCKHSHDDHTAAGSHSCRVKGCSCSCFESNFLCAACDRRWEEHETFFETEETRRRGGRPHDSGTSYLLPFSRAALRDATVPEAPQRTAASRAQRPSNLPRKGMQLC
ncbi:protein FAM221B isoform X2 [Vicugna pacos]|uniref:Protein FAM221B isoform X2 n=1 Tax=Vicugna pacos TaxID=30538 RepID=A0ABM5D4I9_VICPA